jgi:hypothetical protein
MFRKSFAVVTLARIGNIAKSQLAFAGITLMLSAPAHAVSVLELDCRIDNRIRSSMPRKIQLRDGHRESIDCQSHMTCRDSIYEIVMNYNSAYEYVIIEVTDTETQKMLSVTVPALPNTTGDSLKNAHIEFGYGDVVQDLSRLDDMESKGRFLRIDCERKN